MDEGMKTLEEYLKLDKEIAKTIEPYYEGHQALAEREAGNPQKWMLACRQADTEYELIQKQNNLWEELTDSEREEVVKKGKQFRGRHLV
jgi:hypothetical protein